MCSHLCREFVKEVTKKFLGIMLVVATKHVQMNIDYFLELNGRYFSIR